MRRLILALTLVLAAVTPLAAHDGPPFPIVSDQERGPYIVSVWTDPDTTDDGSAGGQFWVQLAMRDGRTVPAGTRAVLVASTPEGGAPATSVVTQALDGDAAKQFGALVLDREGRYTIDVRIEGPAGAAAVAATVDATYDLRPPIVLLPLYVMPFVLVGILWARLLLRRRRGIDAAGMRGSAPVLHSQPSGGRP